MDIECIDLSFTGLNDKDLDFKKFYIMDTYYEDLYKMFNHYPLGLEGTVLWV